MISVVCWLWRDRNFRFRHHFNYTSEHVVRLQRSVAKHLSMPHRFICLTDSPQEAFPAEVEAIPIWETFASYGGCYRRLRAFSPEMKDVIGERFVSIDIDCVVTGSLDPLFSRPEDFVIWKDISPTQPYCGSMFMMTAGARAHVYETFDKETADLLKRKGGYIGTDQAWIASVLKGEATWGQRDGVYSIISAGFRRKGSRPKVLRSDGPAHQLQSMVNQGFTTTLPDDARIVFVHGCRDPSIPAFQQVHPWVHAHWGDPIETIQRP